MSQPYKTIFLRGCLAATFSAFKAAAVLCQVEELGIAELPAPQGWTMNIDSVFKS